MDLLPQIPQSLLRQFVEYINMGCNISPLDLTTINRQIENYVPLVTRIGDGNMFSGVVLKFLFLMALLASIHLLIVLMYSHHQCIQKEFNQIDQSECSILVVL